MVCFIATICLSRPNTHHRIACLGVLRYNSGKGGNSVEDCKGQSVRLVLFHFQSLFTIMLNTNIKRVNTWVIIISDNRILISITF